jgi:hypothetical protein
MEWLHPATHGESAARPVEQMGFDVLRAIVQSRQSATPTVRALVVALPDDASGNFSEQRMRLFTGHRHAAPFSDALPYGGGAFATMNADMASQGIDDAADDARDQPCPDKGECHA